MSFRCQRCVVAQPAGTRPNRVVTRWREHDGDYDRPAIRQIAEEQNWCAACVAEAAAEVEPVTAMGLALKEKLGELCAS
jgi:hypothetical protein